MDPFPRLIRDVPEHAPDRLRIVIGGNGIEPAVLILDKITQADRQHTKTSQRQEKLCHPVNVRTGPEDPLLRKVDNGARGAGQPAAIDQELVRHRALGRR